MLAPPSDCADAKATALTPLRKVTMYSPGIGSPIARSSALFGTVVVVEEVVVDVVDVVDVVVVVEEVVVDVVVDVVLDDEVDVVDEVAGVVEVVDEIEVGGVVVDVGMTVVETEVVEVVVLSATVVVEATVVDTTCVVVEAIVVVEATVVVGPTVVVVLSAVVPTLNVASGSTINTCGSRFKRRTSATSSSATNPFTLLEKTLFTSLPSDSSLLTLAATLAASERMTT